MDFNQFMHYMSHELKIQLETMLYELKILLDDGTLGEAAINLLFIIAIVVIIKTFKKYRKKLRYKKRQKKYEEAKHRIEQQMEYEETKRRMEYEETPYYKETEIDFDRIDKASGAVGESRIFNELDKVGGYHKIVTNCYLPKEDGSTSEVDIIMIHEKGVFVIESKDYSGWIFGNDKQKYWTQSFSGRGGAIKYRFFNPIWQNKAHIESLNNYVDISQYPVYSYIVFSNDCELMDITVDPLDNAEVINRSLLLWSITNKLDTSEIVMDNLKVDELYSTLKQTSKHDEETKSKHISNIKWR